MMENVKVTTWIQNPIRNLNNDTYGISHPVAHQLKPQYCMLPADRDVYVDLTLLDN